MASYPENSSRPRYRPEIDGLRAIAVTAVLIFHFYPNLLPYGYLGVDIFFVISGHIISLYILNDFSNSSFSFSAFYVRRVKRILPATFLVLASSFVISFFSLMGTDFRRFVESLVATLAFVANIFFWRDGGYFGSNDALKPLLHMWSLGVEEQFYLLFPVLFVFVLKFIKDFRRRLLFLSILLMVSFVVCGWMIRSGGANPAFFLMPFRIWQFGVGVVSALVYAHCGLAHHRGEVAASFLVMILGLFFLPEVVVPGFLSSVATAYFLSKTYVPVVFIDRYFSDRCVRYVGLMSFSLYLWHWPVVVFMRYVTVDPLSNLQIIIAVLLTIVLSSLSYGYVERPFRGRIPTAVTLKVLVGVFCCLAVASFCGLYFAASRDGGSLAERLSSATQTHYRCAVDDYIGYGGSRACLINKDLGEAYRVALIGNSHAQMYVPSLRQPLRQRGESGLLIPLNGCLPTIDVNISQDCLRLSRLNYDAFMSDATIKVVVVALTWYGDTLVNDRGEVLNDANKLILAESLLRLLNLVKDTGRDVFLVGPIPIPGYDVPSVLSRRMKFSGYSEAQLQDALRIPRAEFEDRFKDSQAYLEKNLGRAFLRPDMFLCDAAYCYFGDLGTAYFSDSNHLSRYGVAKMDGLFAPVFKQSLRPDQR